MANLNIQAHLISAGDHTGQIEVIVTREGRQPFREFFHGGPIDTQTELVRRINNHDALIAALEALSEAYQDLHNAVFPLSSEDPGLSHIGSDGQEAHDRAIAALKDAGYTLNQRWI